MIGAMPIALHDAGLFDPSMFPPIRDDRVISEYDGQAVVLFLGRVTKGRALP